MADTTPTLREAAQRLLNAIEAVHEAEKSEGHARGGFVRTAPTRAHQRRVAEAWHENAAAVQALRAALAEQAAEQARPDIIERLTYHALERDDLTLDDCLAYLAEGWKRVRGRTERQMVLQLTALLAGAPSAEQAEPVAVPAGWREVIADVAADISDHPSLAYEKLRRLLAAPPAPARQEWQPIATAPKDQFILVSCPSGYTTVPRVATTAIMHSDYKAGRWVDHANDDLTDWGMVPTHWMPLPAAPITAAPAEGEKR